VNSHPSLLAAQAAAERATHQHSPITRRERAAADEARKRAETQALHAHASVFGAGMIVIFSVNLVVNLSAGVAGRWAAWWSVWAFLGWGIGLVINALVVRLARLSQAVSSADRANEAGR